MLLRGVVMVLVRRVVLADSLATAMLLLIRGTIAQASSLLLIPSAQGLAAKHEIVILDDGGLDPTL